MRLALRATPLLIVVLVIEVTDLVFALDSVPAVLTVTTDPFIVFTSNVFAILGLRSIYFVIADSVDSARASPCSGSCRGSRRLPVSQRTS